MKLYSMVRGQQARESKKSKGRKVQGILSVEIEQIHVKARGEGVPPGGIQHRLLAQEANIQPGCSRDM